MNSMRHDADDDESAQNLIDEKKHENVAQCHCEDDKEEEN